MRRVRVVIINHVANYLNRSARAARFGIARSLQCSQANCIFRPMKQLGNVASHGEGAIPEQQIDRQYSMGPGHPSYLAWLVQLTS